MNWLKESPGKATAKGLLNLLDKIETLRAIGIETLDLSVLNPNRRKALAREAARLSPVELRRLKEPRRYTLPVCLLSELLKSCNDQAVETHDQLLKEIYNRSKGRRDAELVKHGQIVNHNLGLLLQMAQIVLDDSIPDVTTQPAEAG